jgi:hypothetical protein
MASLLAQASRPSFPFPVERQSAFGLGKKIDKFENDRQQRDAGPTIVAAPDQFGQSRLRESRIFGSIEGASHRQ